MAAPCPSWPASLPLVAHQARLLAVPVALLYRRPLVLMAAALGDRQLDLGDASIIEVDAERHKGHALAVNLAQQPVDLALVHQELAGGPGLVGGGTGGGVFRDVGVVEVKLAAAIGGIGLADGGAALAQRLH